MLLYPGDAPPRGLHLGSHIGTHVDAPSHFIPGGKPLDQLPLQHFCGDAIVLDLQSRPFIDEADIPDVPRGHHILLKTRNCALIGLREFHKDYCHITPQAAKKLLSFDPLSIGIDYYSLDPFGEVFPAHVAVASRGLPAFVCLDLRNVQPGRYNFIALPLKIDALDGIPVRAILLDDSVES